MRAEITDVIMSSPVRVYLDVVTLEQVEVRFTLTRLFTHQSQDGVIAAGVHHRLGVLD